jgi:hypothetical protein
VTSTKVKNRSLFARDFALGQLPAGTPGANGATGATGPAGPTGPQGLTGIVGGAITVQREDLNVADGVASGFQVTCPAGTKVVGGGSSLDQTSVADIHLTVSRPFRTTPGVDGTLPADGETFDAWRVVYLNPAGGTPATPARVFAICAEV